MELKTLGILGSSGFIGSRICKVLNHKYKIVKVNKNFKSKKSLKIDYLICCSGPNKFWCAKNKEVIINDSNKLAVNIINFCKKNKVRKLIYCSSIQVLNKNNNYLMPYIKWHKNIEKNLKKSNIQKIIIRLPNIFGIPEKNKKNLWDFFINSIIKKSYLQQLIYIKNKPNNKVFAMPLNYFLKILENEIIIKYNRLTKIKNLDNFFKFRTDELIYILKKILKQNDIDVKLSDLSYLKNLTLTNTMSQNEYFYFKKEVKGLAEFIKN